MTTLNRLTDLPVQHKKVAHHRIKVDRDFVVESLGGMYEVKKLSDQFGVSLYRLISRAEMDWVRRYTGQRKGLAIFYTNYMGSIDKKFHRFRPYSDITVELLDYTLPRYNPVVSRSVCSDIGYRQTRDQAKEYIRNWFHAEVTPIFLEYVFM